MPNNQNQNNLQFDDKTMMTDSLMSQKLISNDYNIYANECVTPTLRDEFMNILKEEHQIQSEIFQEMQKRGWYSPAPADQQKITQTKDTYTQQAPQ